VAIQMFLILSAIWIASRHATLAAKG